MIAVDTNVVVRLLTNDDPKQAAAAKSLFAAGPIWIAKTVLLETAWVLRSLYGFEESAIRDALYSLLGLKNVFTEDKPSMVAALDLTIHGSIRAAIDLAAAMHFSSRPPGTVFASFDPVFIRRAKRAGIIEVFGLALKT